MVFFVMTLLFLPGPIKNLFVGLLTSFVRSQYSLIALTGQSLDLLPFLSFGIAGIPKAGLQSRRKIVRLRLRLFQFLKTRLRLLVVLKVRLLVILGDRLRLRLFRLFAILSTVAPHKEECSTQDDSS